MILIKNCNTHNRIIHYRLPSLLTGTQFTFQLSYTLRSLGRRGVRFRSGLLDIFLADQRAWHLDQLARGNFQTGAQYNNNTVWLIGLGEVERPIRLQSWGTTRRN